jgi:hypothetical protein
MSESLQNALLGLLEYWIGRYFHFLTYYSLHECSLPISNVVIFLSGG